MANVRHPGETALARHGPRSGGRDHRRNVPVRRRARGGGVRPGDPGGQLRHVRVVRADRRLAGGGRSRLADLVGHADRLRPDHGGLLRHHVHRRRRPGDLGGWNLTAAATTFSSGGSTLADSGTLSVTGSTSSAASATAPSAACAPNATCAPPTESGVTYPVPITTAPSAPTPVKTTTPPPPPGRRDRHRRRPPRGLVAEHPGQRHRRDLHLHDHAGARLRAMTAPAPPGGPRQRRRLQARRTTSW